jgi:membrane associated rhomboid family serine protease
VTIGSLRRVPVTTALIVLTTGAFVFWQHGFSGVNPDALAAQGGVLAAPEGAPWRWVAALFLHATPPHLGMNMISLWFVGNLVEPSGSAWQFLSVYLGSGILGNVLAAYTEPVGTVTVGASGAIFGVAGAVWVIAGRQAPPRRRALRRWLLGIVLVNAVLDVSVPNISWQGHAGGLLAGVLLAWLAGYGRRVEHHPRS